MPYRKLQLQEQLVKERGAEGKSAERHTRWVSYKAIKEAIFRVTGVAAIKEASCRVVRSNRNRGGKL